MKQLLSFAPWGKNEIGSGPRDIFLRRPLDFPHPLCYNRFQSNEEE